ncbi:MAG: PAS domain S-box protein, partial [Planctomycetota bacterium]
DISSRVANGNRGRIAIKTLDNVRRPFLDIHKVESLLLTNDYNKEIHENFDQALKSAIRLIANFKTVAAYNPDLLWRVEKLENTFEKWINYERVLIDQAESKSIHNVDLFSDAESFNLLSMVSRYFYLTMKCLGDAEVPIHKDIHEGSKGQFELIISSGILLLCFIFIVIFLQWFKNKGLKRVVEINKQTELRLISMANILEESLNEIYIFDSKTLHFVKVNKGARLNLGYSMEELSSLTPLDLKPEITSEHFEKILEPLRNGKKDKIHFTNIHRRKDGSLYDVELHIQPSIYDSKPVFVATILDITERKHAEDVIRNSEEQLNAIIDNTTAVIYIKDVKGKYILINRQFEKLFRIRKNEITGQTDYDIFPKDKASAFSDNDKKVIETRKPMEFEEYVPQDDGLHTYISIKFPLSNVKDVIYGVCGISTDITERKQMEIELMESEERYRVLVSSVRDYAIFMITPDGIVISWNEGVKEIKGYSADEIIGKHISIFYPEKDIKQKKIEYELQKAKEDGQYEDEGWRVRKDGSRFWANVVITALYDDSRTLKGYTKVTRDFSKRKQMEEELKVLNKSLEKRVAERTKDVSKTNEKLKLEIAERKRTEDELHKKNSYFKLLKVTAVAANKAEDIHDAFLPILKQICGYTGWEIGHAYSISENNPDLLKPTEVWCIEEKTQFMDFCSVTKKTNFPRGVGLPGRVLASCKPHWITNVAEDKNFLRKKVARALNIKSGIAFPVMVGVKVVSVLEFFTTEIIEPDQPFMDIMADVGTQLGRVVERMKAAKKEVEFKRFFDLSIDMLCIAGIDCYFKKINSSFGKILGYSDKELLSQPFIYFIHPDDKTRTIEVVENKISKGDDVINFENRYRCKDGSYRWFMWTAKPVIEEGIMFGIARDVTEHKQIEEALIQSEKMKAMGIMTSGVAHEFNNILAVISNNAQLLKEAYRYRGDIELMKSLSIICRMVDDGAEIVDRMYEFIDIKKDTSKFSSIDLNDLIKQVIGFTMPRWKEMAHAKGIIYNIDQKDFKEIPAVLGNPSEIREVLLNIVNNALDEMPVGGKVSFYTWNDKDSVFVAISDTGNGMSEEVKKKIFDPFFTTRSPEGTGLGMSVSYGIIKRHGGNIDVESELGKGSTIILSLPVFRKSFRQVVTPKKTMKLKVKNLNVLIVDDKKDVAESLGKLFVEEGQNVCVVTNGVEAIRLLKNKKFDLMLCDLVMPVVNGRDIVKMVNTMKKKPKVGLITGWKYNVEDTEIEDMEVDFVVKKPFNLSVLRRDINNIFNSL